MVLRMGAGIAGKIERQGGVRRLCQLLRAIVAAAAASTPAAQSASATPTPTATDPTSPYARWQRAAAVGTPADIPLVAEHSAAEAECEVGGAPPALGRLVASTITWCALLPPLTAASADRR